MADIKIATGEIIAVTEETDAAWVSLEVCNEGREPRRSQDVVSIHFLGT